MGNFKTMKIRVTDSNREAVKAALLAEGYEPEGKMANLPIFDEAVAYYTYGERMVLCTTKDHSKNNKGDSYFNEHENPEYILHNGELVPAEEYHKQPETPPMKEPSQERPIVGLCPRYVREAQRLQEVLGAMLRFSQAGKVIPKAWREELAELLYKQEMMGGQ